MNISNLNVRITFQKNAVVIDKIGNHTNEWQDYYSCYATVSGETGTEQAIVGETVENVEVCFSVRYCEKISSIISTKYRIYSETRSTTLLLWIIFHIQRNT